GSGFRGGLPGTHAEAPDLRAGEGNNRVEYAPVHSLRAGTVGHSRPAVKAGQGAGTEGRRAGTGVEQPSYQSEGHAGGTGEGRKPGNETGSGKGTRGLDRRRPGAPEELWRRSPSTRCSSGRKRENAGTDRHDD